MFTLTDSASPVFRVTRSRLQTKQHERAIAILDEPVPPLIIDKSRLNKVLDNLVTVTANFKVEKLEKVYSSLSQCIFLHKKDFDKTALTMVGIYILFI